MAAPPTDDDQTLLIKLATTVWGAFGDNGLNSDVKHHGEQIGDLYGRDETLRSDIDVRLRMLDERLNDRLGGIYKLLATLTVSMLVSAVGIIATLLVTQ